MIRRRAHGALLVWIGACALAIAAPVAAGARTPATAHFSSVVSLLSPAHGSAFAYATSRQLLSTKRAVGSASSVDVVTATGQRETVSVRATGDPGLVLLVGHIELPPLTAASPASGLLVAQAGPLNGGRRQHGRLVAGSAVTTMRASRSYEGAPLLDGHGRVAGVATEAGRRLGLISASGVRGRSTPGGTSPFLVLALLILLSVAAVVAARAAFRLGIGARPRQATRGASSDPPGAHAPADVVIRRSPRHPPAEGVRLRRRRAETGDVPPDEED